MGECRYGIHSTRYLTTERRYWHRTWHHCVKEYEPEMILLFFLFYYIENPRNRSCFDISWNICHDGFLHGVISDFVKLQVDKHRTSNEDDVLCCSTLTRNGVSWVTRMVIAILIIYMIKLRKDSKGCKWIEVVYWTITHFLCQVIQNTTYQCRSRSSQRQTTSFASVIFCVFVAYIHHW